MAVVRGCARMASSRFMALDRRHNPTIRRLYNSGSVWGDAANIAFSVAFLSCVPLRLFLLFFFFLSGCRGAAVDHRSTLAVLLPLANNAASWQDG